MLYAIPDILFKLELNTNNTGDQLYIIPEILLKVALMTNKTGHDLIRYS